MKKIIIALSLLTFTSIIVSSADESPFFIVGKTGNFSTGEWTKVGLLIGNNSLVSDDTRELADKFFKCINNDDIINIINSHPYTVTSYGVVVRIPEDQSVTPKGIIQLIPRATISPEQLIEINNSAQAIDQILKDSGIKETEILFSE